MPANCDVLFLGQIESCRAALARCNAEMDAARAEIEKLKAAALPFDPDSLSKVYKTPEDILQLVGLCMAGKRAQFDDVDQARAFAAGLDELSCERLVQACLERGRLKSLLVRIQAAAHRALGDTVADPDCIEEARRAVLRAVVEVVDAGPGERAELRELLALVLDDLAAVHPLRRRIVAALEQDPAWCKRCQRSHEG